MKNIKFRQWTGSEWHYWGFYNNLFTNPVMDTSFGDGSYPDSLMFSGSTDSNKVEIFEGDILHVQYSDQYNADDYDAYVKVYSENGCVMVDYSGFGEDYKLSVGDFIEQIEDHSLDDDWSVVVFGNRVENSKLWDKLK